MSRFIEGTALLIVLSLIVFGIAYAHSIKVPIIRDFDTQLLGGLIGAAGTIFAGWLVWSQTRDQIKETERQQIRQERLTERFNVDRAKQEIEWLDTAKTYASRLLANFDGAEQALNGFNAAIGRMTAAGSLTQLPFGPVQVQEISTTIQTFFNRLQSFQQLNRESVQRAASYAVPIDHQPSEANRQAQLLDIAATDQVRNASVQAAVAQFRGITEDIERAKGARQLRIEAFEKLPKLD